MFRSNAEPFLVGVFPKDHKALIHIHEPTLISLTAAVVSVMPSWFMEEFCRTSRLYFYTIREGNQRWKLEDDRDTEELSGTPQSREPIYISVHPPEQFEQLPCLRDFPLPRSWVPCSQPASNVYCTDQKQLNGSELLNALRYQGYFKILLDQNTMSIVRDVFEATKKFFSSTQEFKQTFAGSTSQRLAPYFGYRKTSLNKELFVFRNTYLHDVPEDLKILIHGFYSMGSILESVMRAILFELGWEQDRIESSLKGATEKIDQEESLRFSSFLEIFRYDCSPSERIQLPEESRYRIICGEHRDTSLLTIIPRCEGCNQGLEVYNWETGNWHCAELDLKEDEAIVFAGELFPTFTNTDLSALCHRVVVPLEHDVARYSIPFEFLPYPDLEMREALSSLGSGLVSVNY